MGWNAVQVRETAPAVLSPGTPLLQIKSPAGSPPSGLGGSGPTITNPSARITLAEGNTINANLPGVNATLGAILFT